MTERLPCDHCLSIIMRSTIFLLVSSILVVHTYAGTTHFGPGKVDDENYSCVLQCFKQQPSSLTAQRETLVPCVSNCLQKIVDALREWLNQLPTDETQDATTRKDYSSLYRQGIALQGQLINLKKVVDMPTRLWDLMSFLPHPAPMFPNLFQPLQNLQHLPPFLPQGFSSPMPGNVLGQIIQLFRNILDEIIRRHQNMIALLYGCASCDDNSTMTTTTMSTTTTGGATTTTAVPTTTTAATTTTTAAPAGRSIQTSEEETVDHKPVVNNIVKPVVDHVVNPVVDNVVKPTVDYVKHEVHTVDDDVPIEKYVPHTIARPEGDFVKPVVYTDSVFPVVDSEKPVVLTVVDFIMPVDDFKKHVDHTFAKPEELLKPIDHTEVHPVSDVSVLDSEKHVVHNVEEHVGNYVKPEEFLKPVDHTEVHPVSDVSVLDSKKHVVHNVEEHVGDYVKPEEFLKPVDHTVVHPVSDASVVDSQKHETHNVVEHVGDFVKPVGEYVKPVIQLIHTELHPDSVFPVVDSEKPVVDLEKHVIHTVVEQEGDSVVHTVDEEVIKSDFDFVNKPAVVEKELEHVVDFVKPVVDTEVKPVDFTVVEPIVVETEVVQPAVDFVVKPFVETH